MRRTILALLSTVAIGACTSATSEDPPTPAGTGAPNVATDKTPHDPTAAVPVTPAPGNPAPGNPGSGSAGPVVPSARSIPFAYKVTVPVPTESVEMLRVWVPLPMEEEGIQEVHDLVIAAPEGYRVTHDSVYGNAMVYVEVARPTAPIEISWTARIVRHVDHGQGAGPMSSRYLEADRLVPTNGRALELATSLGVTDTSKPVSERATSVFMDVLDTMAYDKKHDGWGLGSFEHATTVCKGNCTDFHARFTGIGRAAGIPVRFSMGIPLAKSEPGVHTYDSYHCWAHWHDGHNWKPVDISEADKIVDKDRPAALLFNGSLPTNRVGMTLGRDVVLEPPQAGEPLNYVIFPYAEVDGRAWPLPKGSWGFTYTNE